jgi:predicted ATPase
MPNPTSPAIQSLEVQGLLSFGEPTRFEFGRLNLLVGPNGSGKSNLLDCLRIFRSCPSNVQEAFHDGGLGDWVHRGMEADLSVIELTAHLPSRATPVWHWLVLEEGNQAPFALSERIAERGTAAAEPYFSRARDHAYLSAAEVGSSLREKVTLGPDEYSPRQSILAQIRDRRRYPEITELAALYSSFRIYSEWSFGRGSVLRESTPADRSDPYLSESLDNLALVLNGFQGTPAHDRNREVLSELK